MYQINVFDWERLRLVSPQNELLNPYSIFPCIRVLILFVILWMYNLLAVQITKQYKRKGLNI